MLERLISDSEATRNFFEVWWKDILGTMEAVSRSFRESLQVGISLELRQKTSARV